MITNKNKPRYLQPYGGNIFYSNNCKMNEQLLLVINDKSPTKYGPFYHMFCNKYKNCLNFNE